MELQWKNLPNNASNDHLGNTERGSLERRSNELQQSSNVNSFLSTETFSNHKDSDGTIDTTNPNNRR
jgi:hypothetical protein